MPKKKVKKLSKEIFSNFFAAKKFPPLIKFKGKKGRENPPF